MMNVLHVEPVLRLAHLLPLSSPGIFIRLLQSALNAAPVLIAALSMLSSTNFLFFKFKRAPFGRPFLLQKFLFSNLAVLSLIMLFFVITF